MKKTKITKLIAIVLVVAMLSASLGAVTAGASSMYPVVSNGGDLIGVLFADIVDTLLRILTDFLASLFGDGPTFYPDGDAELQEKIDANYYDGTGKDFQKSAAANAQWHLGYANTSLIPEDYDNGTYYIGGYIAPENGFTNVVEGIAEIPGIGKDDMKVRCMAISDGSETYIDDKGEEKCKNVVLFAVIDSIGITNADIKDIRELLADYAKANNIVAINVSSTHCHSGIDTEGLWTRNIAKLVSNGVISGTTPNGDLQQGTNPAYMAWMKEMVAEALKKAHKDMKPGSLTYTTKDIGQDYFQNKNRPSSGQIASAGDNGTITDNETGRIIAMTDIERFIFTPDDTSAKPTMILNIAAHPDVAGLPTESNSGREISGDYVFYCGKYLEDAGYNFIFFQGAIAGIYMSRGATGDDLETKQRVEESQRFGFELARIALNLEKTEEEVYAASWDKSSDIYSELEANATLIDAFANNISAVEQVTTSGNNYTVVIDAQGKTVDIANNTVKILDNGNLVYELKYSEEVTFAYDEEAKAQVVSKDSETLAVIATGDGGNKIVCPNDHSIVVYSADGVPLKTFVLGRSRVVSPLMDTLVYNQSEGFRPEIYDSKNNYTLALDSQGYNVSYDNNTHKLTTYLEKMYSPYDTIHYFDDIGAYVVFDFSYTENHIAAQNALSAFESNGEEPVFKFTENGKIALYHSDGTQYSVDGEPKEFDCTVKSILSKKDISSITDTHIKCNDVIDANGMTVTVNANTNKLTIDDNSSTVLNRTYTAMDYIHYFEDIGAYVVFNFVNPTNATAIGQAVRAFVAAQENPTIKFKDNGKLALYFADGTQYSVDGEPQEFDYAIKTIVTTADPAAASSLPAYCKDVIDAKELDVVYDDSTAKLTATHYDLTFSTLDYIHYFEDLKSYVVLDLISEENLMNVGKAINAFITARENPTIKFTDSGKLTLYFADGSQYSVDGKPQEFDCIIKTVLTTEDATAISKLPTDGRQIVYADSVITVSNVIGASDKCQIKPRYTVWFDNWNKDKDGKDAIPAVQPVEPFLNLYIKQVEVPITNTLITAIGKLNMANYVVISEGNNKYSTMTEIGYMELGNQFKAVFLPGEICQDLVAPGGASLSGANSATARPMSQYVKYGATSASDIFGKDIKCFGVMNDAIGYVVPDNDYTMGDPVNHYHELISLGQHVGSSLIDGLYELAVEVGIITK